MPTSSLFLLLLAVGCCAPATGTARSSTKLTASDASYTQIAVGSGSGGPVANGVESRVVGSAGQQGTSTDEGQLTQGQDDGSKEALLNPATGQRQQEQQQQVLKPQHVRRRLQQEGQRAGERRGGDGNDEASPPGHDGKDQGDAEEEEEEEEEDEEDYKLPSRSSSSGASSGSVTGPAGTISFPPSRRCVFILGTGRSGSTALMDALNQLPHYLIRGEQEGAFWFLYLTYRQLIRSWRHSKDYVAMAEEVERREGVQVAAHLGYRVVKRLYDSAAVESKLPCFNDLHPDRVADAVRAMYTMAYGYHGPGVVSGFKEIRFVAGRAFPLETGYPLFESFVEWLLSLCNDVKVLLNSRLSASLEDNWKLEDMLWSNNVIKLDGEKCNRTFAANLKATHKWFDRYASEHPDHAMRVYMEHMFDPQTNATLAASLLSFLGEEEEEEGEGPRGSEKGPPLSFVRMPSWFREKKHEDRKKVHRDFWMI